MYIHSISMTPN